MNKKVRKLEVKPGDIVEFEAISWDQPWWDFDYPTLITKPVFSYSPNGNHPESMIEDLCIKICCDNNNSVEDEDISHEFKWRRWSLPWIKRVIRERFQGKNTWKTMAREVVRQKVEFYEEHYGEGEVDLAFRVIETKNA